MFDQELLDTIIRRIVEVAQPEKIILFGSAARGEMGPNSDLDILVIKSCPRRRKLAMEIYRHVSGMGCALDIIVVTPENVERYGQSPGLIIEPALREGKVVYAARATVAGRSALLVSLFRGAAVLARCHC